MPQVVLWLSALCLGQFSGPVETNAKQQFYIDSQQFCTHISDSCTAGATSYSWGQSKAIGGLYGTRLKKWRRSSETFSELCLRHDLFRKPEGFFRKLEGFFRESGSFFRRSGRLLAQMQKVLNFAAETDSPWQFCPEFHKTKVGPANWSAVSTWFKNILLSDT